MAENKGTTKSNENAEAKPDEKPTEANSTEVKSKKKVEKNTDRHGTPIVSFEELDEHQENIPGIAAPPAKK